MQLEELRDLPKMLTGLEAPKRVEQPRLMEAERPAAPRKFRAPEILPRLHFAEPLAE
jgi:hypothetical protein